MYRFRSLPLTDPAPFVKHYVRITLVILIVFVALLFLPWRQTIKGTGKLTALDPTQRDYVISATIEGFVAGYDVKENRFVEKGARLFSMVDPDTRYQERIAEITRRSEEKFANEKRKIERLRKNLAEVAQIRRDGLQEYDKKIARLENDRLFVQRQLAAARDKEAMEERNYGRARRLQKEGIVSTQALERARNALLQSRAQRQKYESDLANLGHSLQILRHEKERFAGEMAVRTNGLEARLLELQNRYDTLRQEWRRNETALSRYGRREIRAKSDGYVMEIYQNDINKLIKKGEKILYFSPVVTRRALRVRISDFHMPLVRKGLKVRIIFYGWPAMQIPGWPKISHGTYGGVVASVEHSSHEKGVYYVMVTEDPDDAPWPDPKLLKIGTQATVWVQLGVVPIWYELWRMMVAQPPNMVRTDTPGEYP